MDQVRDESNGSGRGDSKAKWISLAGDFEFGKTIKFNGVTTTFMDSAGKTSSGVTLGIAMSNTTFSGGDISAGVMFSDLSKYNSCEIIFYYDAKSRAQVSAGIGGPGSAFVIRQYNNQWNIVAQSGTRESLQSNYIYELRVNVRGSRVTVYVDGIEVLGSVIPSSLPPSQAGIFCSSDAPIDISNYKVDSRKGNVFVVMQFSSPFNEIHEEIIKNVCAEFDLVALRGDESYGPGIILSDITRSIDESEFIIAEITPSNPNVYYELGYAHAVNKPVILLADRAIEKLPFDVSSFRVLFYDNSMIGRSKFEDGLRRHISAILSKNTLLPAMSGAAPPL